MVALFQQFAHLIFAFVVDAVIKTLAVGYIELEATEGPRNEDDVACLCVERKILDVQCTVGLNQCREQPQNSSPVVLGTCTCTCT